MRKGGFSEIKTSGYNLEHLYIELGHCLPVTGTETDRNKDIEYIISNI